MGSPRRHNIKFGTVSVIGCGGIGSWLVPPLARFVANLDRPPLLRLIDGDRVEEKNCVRQNFYPADVNQMKSTVLSEAVSLAFPQLPVESIEAFFGAGTEITPDNHLVLAGPDNHKCRRDVLDRLRDGMYDSIAVLGGNEESDGTVICYGEESGSEPLISFSKLGERHPEILEAQDDDRSAMSCAALAALPSGGQTMAANYMAASIMFNCAVLALTGTIPPMETYFDVSTGKVRVVEEEG